MESRTALIDKKRNTKAQIGKRLLTKLCIERTKINLFGFAGPKIRTGWPFNLRR